MKKVSSLMILLLAGVIMFVSCSSPSSGGTPAGNDGGNKFSLSNYQFTDEVKLMDTPATITGSKDYNRYYPGVFPPGRTVTLSPFIMGKYEVTQELYEAVMTGQKVTAGGEQKSLSANPSYCTSTNNDYKNMLQGEEQKYRPVEGVTWYDACYFCNALSEKLGLKKAYDITVETVSTNGNITKATVTPVARANGYRLPTEAEWEYAARGGSKATAEQFKYFFSGAITTNYSASEYADETGVPWENEDLDKAGWYWYNIKSGKTESENPSSGDAGYGTHQVGKKDANAAGLCDMSGNVWEWCYDWYATISADAVTDPSGPSEAWSYRVNRGGSWAYFAHGCAVSYRNYYILGDCAVSNQSYSSPDNRSFDLGFRVVRNAQ